MCVASCICSNFIGYHFRYRYVCFLFHFRIFSEIDRNGVAGNHDWLRGYTSNATPTAGWPSWIAHLRDVRTRSGQIQAIRWSRQAVFGELEAKWSWRGMVSILLVVFSDVASIGWNVSEIWKPNTQNFQSLNPNPKNWLFLIFSLFSWPPCFSPNFQIWGHPPCQLMLWGT